MEDDSGGKRFEGFVYHTYLSTAVMVDFLGLFIPFIGAIFVMFARTSLTLGGYRGLSPARFITALIFEAIPGLSMLPVCTLFVIRTKVTNTIKNTGSENKV